MNGALYLPPVASKGREHWRAVHIAGDRNPPFHRHEPLRPFWKPAWHERPARDAAGREAG